MPNPLGGLGGPGLGGMGQKVPTKTILRVVLLLSGFLAVVFGLMLASRSFGFPLFFELDMATETLTKLTAVVAIIAGAFTLFNEIKTGFGGGGDLGGLPGV